jgi:hypothetical protein
MFKNFSMAQAGNYAVILSTILALFGSSITEGDITTTLKTICGIIALIGAGISYIGRWRTGDLTLAGFRKS